jgi:hypothetical protein
MLDLSQAGFEDAVEDGSGVGVGVHAREKLCYGERKGVSNRVIGDPAKNRANW